MHRKKGRWEKWEEEYILKNYERMTDEDLATFLNRTRLAVTEKRRGLGAKKNIKKEDQTVESVQTIVEKHRAIQDAVPLADMDDAQERQAFLSELLHSPMWPECIEIFNEKEQKLYQYNYVETMMNLETVTGVEKNTIHIMLCSLIRLNRYQKMEKELHKMGPSADKLSLHREIKDTHDIYTKAQTELNVSRRQRIKEEGDQRLNLIELIKELDAKDAREKLGREADALKHIERLEGKRLTDKGFVRGTE